MLCELLRTHYWIQNDSLAPRNHDLGSQTWRPSTLTAEELRLELACALYARGRISAVGGAHLGGVDLFSFQGALKERGLPRHLHPPRPTRRHGGAAKALPGVIVVADTSVLLNLCCVGQQELLPELFREVAIPPEVRQEFERAARVYPRFASLTIPVWVRERPPRSVPQSLRQIPKLDSGEIAALALDLAATAVLSDEMDGRQVARQHGLTPIGVLGVLVRARRVGLLPAIGPVRAKSNRAEFPLELVADFRHLPSA